MIARLRAELKAIVEWDRQTFVFGTVTAKEAVVIHEMRRREIMRGLVELVSRN